MIQTLHRDDHLVVVVKPFGMLTQADRTGDPDLLTAVKELTGGFVGMVHRLDRPVGGLVLFARTRKAAARLTEMFGGREVEKRYAAVVLGRPDRTEGELTGWLVKDEAANRVAVHAAERPGSKKGVTRYRMEQSDGERSLLTVWPMTGRSHQIRAQLAAAGLPIEGDVKYGAPRPLPDGSVRLFAYGLAFDHPVTGEELDLTVPLPDDWGFSL